MKVRNGDEDSVVISPVVSLNIIDCMLTTKSPRTTTTCSIWLNGRALRHLEVNWVYGVGEESGRKNVRGILQNIEDMEDSQEEEIQK